MDTVMSICSTLFLLFGSFLCISGGLGIIRFPDFYTRIHAVGVTDTLATAMIVIGLMFYNTDGMTMLDAQSPVRIKLLLILVLTLFLSPTACHALAKAAIKNNLMPLLGDNSHKRGAESSNP
jgi:multicomponent Na+:H+ antiporter subunit G